MKSKRVILFETSELIRLGFERLFSLHNNQITLVQSVSDVDMLYSAIKERRAQIIIINPIYTGSASAHIIGEVKALNPNIVVAAIISTHTPSSILDCFDIVLDIYHDNNTIHQLLLNGESNSGAESSCCEELTKREIDIITLVAKGLINKEIADKLNISIHTVITHRKNISKKTGIKSISGLTMFAVLNKLI